MTACASCLWFNTESLALCVDLVLVFLGEVLEILVVTSEDLAITID